MSFTLGGPRLRPICACRGLVAVPLLMAAACGSNVEEVSDVVLARHVHTDFYDAYPGIPSPAGDQVVFADYAADSRSLAVYDVATGVGRVVTRTPAGRSRVTWSPDGSRVVYVDRWPESHGVWTLDPTTGQESRIVDPGDARIDYPRLLPDGTVTALRHAGADTAWVAYAPGLDEATVLVDDAGGWTAPVRSPDGRAVAYLRAAGGRAALAMTEIATGEPDWSPDGRSLAFSSHGPPLEGNPGSVYSIAVDPATGRAASDPVRVPLDGFQGSAMGARFSPDGARLAFYGRSREDGRVTVYTVPTAGGTPTAVVSLANGEPYSAPEWSADGASLFYSRNDGFGPFQVWRVDILTGATEQVTTGVFGALQPSLSPDGRTLAVTIREAAIEVVALAAGSTGAEDGSSGW